MSYTLALQCGCLVYVSCHPRTEVAHTRVIERRGETCRHRFHDVGTHFAAWELPAERQTVPSEAALERDRPARR